MRMLDDPSKPRMYMRGFVGFLGALVLVARLAHCQVSQPLGGYFRPGRCIPLRVSSADGQLSGSGGVIPTSWSGSPSIVPVLINGDSPTNLKCSDGSTISLRPAGDAERIVAFTRDAQQAAAGLFTSQKHIDATVDDADPLPGPPIAWESLDAVVVSPVAMSRLRAEQRAALLGAGVELAAIGDQPPDQVWPWIREGALWVLRHQPAGPGRGELVDDSVFAPTYSWPAGWSAAFRSTVFSVGVLIGIVAIGLALWLRPKWAVIGIVVLSIVSSGAVAAWRRSLGIVSTAGGDVIVVLRDRLVQRDAWVYERARADGLRIVPWDGWTRPVLASDGQLASIDLRMNVTPDEISFQYSAHRGQTVAFVHRQVVPRYDVQWRQVHETPMRDLATLSYLASGRTVLGETRPASPARWPGVVLAEDGSK
jgi:hypothetical protein